MTRLVLGVSLKAYFGYPQTLQWARAAAGAIGAHAHPGLEMFVLPSFPAIPSVHALLAAGPAAVGAQDVAAADAGNQTGEVTAAMLAGAGCRYVAVGHAERRARFGETEQIVAAKTAAVLRAGMIPVLCLGEVDRLDAADAARESVRQLRSALAGAPTGRVVVAYEPHWAIGAPTPASDRHIAAVVDALRAEGARFDAASSVIYGGSAGPGLLTRLGGDIDGLFLGRFVHDPAALATVLGEAADLLDGNGATPAHANVPAVRS